MAKEQSPTSEFTRRVYDAKLWQHRYNALEGMIKTLQKSVDDHAPNREGCREIRQQTFTALLTKLQKFAKAQFDFLHDGLGSQLNYNHPGSSPVATGYLEPSLEYPADFVLEATLDQIAFDVTVLQGAWYQRLLSEKNRVMCKTLEIADRLAYSALQPALEYGLLPFEPEEVTVLTYFQKAPHIRMIPYASVALVGIPFTTLGEYQTGNTTEVGNARDFLSIPHEIGHYVYRHGSSDGSRLQYALNEALLGQPEWLHNWAEEIFADVYGVLIAGPVMVRDFQDIVKDNDLPSLLNDDNTHPMPVLRPLLYVDALKLLASKLDKTAEGDELREQAEELGKPPDDLIRPADALQHIADEAEDRWTKYRGSRGQAHIDERRGIIEQAVKTAFDILSKGQLVPINDLWSRPNLDSALTRADKYEKLYNDFYEDVAGKPGGLLERLRKTAVPDSQVGWATPLQTLPTLQWLEQIRNTATNGNAPPGRFPPEVWTLVVSMAGWATNGPESNPSPKVT